jgi:peptidoglycan L-alanyl-D-glutamate endopeptidase CwlK
MKYSFSKRSLLRLEGVHPDLIKIVSRAMSMQIMDFAITYGLRTEEEQKELYAQGRTRPGPIVTWTLNSEHIKGRAIDIAPYPIDWGNELRFARLAGIMQSCAVIEGVEIEWGGTWKNKDMPHFQLRR